MMKMHYLIAASVAAIAFGSTAMLNAPERVLSKPGAQTLPTALAAQAGAQLSAPVEASIGASSEAFGRVAVNRRASDAPPPLAAEPRMQMSPGEPQSKSPRMSNPAPLSQPAQLSASSAAPVDAPSVERSDGLQKFRYAFMTSAPLASEKSSLSPSGAQGSRLAQTGAQSPIQAFTQSTAQSTIQPPAAGDGAVGATKDATNDSRTPNATESLFSGPVAQKSSGPQTPPPAQGAAPLPQYVKASKRVTMNPVAVDAANIDIDLFGETVTAVRDRVDRRQAGTVIWHGHVQGNPGEFVTIVSRGSAWSGTVDYKGRKFELTGAPGQGLVFNEVDLPALPSNDDDGVVPPQGGAPTTQPDSTPPSAGAPIEQDLLVVYTDDACVGAGGVSGVDCSQVEAAIVAAVADMNQSYIMSNINIVSNLVGMLEVQYDEGPATDGKMLSQIRNTNDGFIDNVHTTRDALGADIVSFIVQDGDGYCGVGYVGGGASSAFSWTMRSCLSNRTQHHEIGHNQGSSHARAQASSPRPGDYHYGYRRCNNGSAEDFGAPYFRTIMAYSCSGAARTGFFANPNVNHLGVPTGIDPNVDPDNAAYSARTINERAAYMAGFRDPPTGPPPVTPPAAPSNLVASVAGTDRINISWFDNAGDETSFNIERSPDDASWTRVATLGADVTGYSDNGLSPDTIYYYRVQAENGAGVSAWSNTVSATTDPLITSIIDVAIGQITGTGKISGSYTKTRLEDGGVQRFVEETQSNGTIGFQHSWIFNVTGGAGDVVLTAKVWTYGQEGANFHYSTDGGATYHLMFTADKERALARAQHFTMPAGTSGQVRIRMTDAERRSNETPDVAFVDYLGFASNTFGF